MKNGTREDYELLAKLEEPFIALTADRILNELKQAGKVTLEGYKITRLNTVYSLRRELCEMVQILTGL